jgi:hypothetical protein
VHARELRQQVQTSIAEAPADRGQFPQATCDGLCSFLAGAPKASARYRCSVWDPDRHSPIDVKFSAGTALGKNRKDISASAPFAGKPEPVDCGRIDDTRRGMAKHLPHGLHEALPLAIARDAGIVPESQFLGTRPNFVPAGSPALKGGASAIPRVEAWCFGARPQNFQLLSLPLHACGKKYL